MLTLYVLNEKRKFVHLFYEMHFHFLPFPVSRVLGDELRRLRTLSVCYCGLEDLDGISYAPNIVNLCAADNQISDVYPVTELRKIHTLDLAK